MPDPRKIVDFEGIADPSAYVTFKSDGVTIVYDATQPRGAAAATLDKAVSLSADSTAQLAADGDAILGKLMLVEPDGMVTVQVKDFVKLPGGNGATLTRGNKVVGALGAGAARGYIRDAASATAAEIVKGRGIVTDKADLTNVVVLL